MTDTSTRPAIVGDVIGRGYIITEARVFIGHSDDPVQAVALGEYIGSDILPNDTAEYVILNYADGNYSNVHRATNYAGARASFARRTNQHLDGRGYAVRSFGRKV